MASRRMIPTRFFKDPDILALSSKDTQLILIGLTLAADDEGREVAHAGLLGREMDYPPEQIERALQELEANDLLLLYRVGKHRYYFLTRWNEWQTLGTKKRPSRYPAPPLPETTDEVKWFDSSIVSSEEAPFQNRSEAASISPAFAGKCWQKSPQGNRKESSVTEGGETHALSEDTNDRDQAKVIPFPPPAAPANAEETQGQAPSLTMLVSQVAQVLKLEVSEALTRLIAEYACCSSLSLLGEADAAREWIDDVARNRKGSHMTLAFFRRWLQRAQAMIDQRQVPREQQTASWLVATGTTGPGDAVSSGLVNAGRGRLPSLMGLVDLDEQVRGGRN